MTFARTVAAVILKDLRIEWRSPARSSAVLFFGLAIVLLVAFAADVNLRRLAGSTLWMSLLLASTRSLDRSFAVELEQGALEGLVLWPVSAFALFYGKAIANTLVLVVVAVALVPPIIALFDADVRGSFAEFGAFLVFGCAAIAAPGTIYALITAKARAASAMLPVLLFPLVMPAMIAAARGTSAVIDGDLMHESRTWLGLLAAFAGLHWTIGGFMFSVIAEDG